MIEGNKASISPVNCRAFTSCKTVEYEKVINPFASVVKVAGNFRFNKKEAGSKTAFPRGKANSGEGSEKLISFPISQLLQKIIKRIMRILDIENQFETNVQR
jgi:hypothetical protein